MDKKNRGNYLLKILNIYSIPLINGSVFTLKSPAMYTCFFSFERIANFLLSNSSNEFNEYDGGYINIKNMEMFALVTIICQMCYVILWYIAMQPRSCCSCMSLIWYVVLLTC